MWALLADTLRQTARRPAPYLLMGMGVLALLAARSLSILALGGGVGVEEAGETPLVTDTAATFGIVLSLSVLLQALDRDRHSGFCLAAQQTRVGPLRWTLGRFLGAALLGSLAAWALLLLGWALFRTAGDDMLLYITITAHVLQASAWGLLCSRILGSAGLTMLGALGLVLLGLLPWGSPGFFAGGLGATISALLPGRLSQLAVLPAAGSVTLGLLLLALALPLRWNSPA